MVVPHSKNLSRYVYIHSTASRRGSAEKHQRSRGFEGYNLCARICSVLTRMLQLMRVVFCAPGKQKPFVLHLEFVVMQVGWSGDGVSTYSRLHYHLAGEFALSQGVLHIHGDSVCALKPKARQILLPLSCMVTSATIETT